MNGPSRAEQILLDLGVTSPRDIDLEAVAWDLGVVDVKRRHLDGCEARIVGDGDRAIISIDPRPIARRQRFSLAHELGHWIHHRGRTLFCAKADIMAKEGGNSFERTANSFAADLLLPGFLLAPLARARPKLTTTVVRELADEFQTTKSATALRLVGLGLHPVLAISYSRSAGKQWFARSPLVPERWFPGPELNHQTYAFDLLHGRGGELANPRKVGADAFFDRYGADRYEIQEQSFKTGDDTILTLVTLIDGDMLED